VERYGFNGSEVQKRIQEGQKEMLEYLVAIGLAIMAGAGVFYLIKRQDIQVEKWKNE
jgi:LPXTG-motif cell wall-anchored protein